MAKHSMIVENVKAGLGHNSKFLCWQCEKMIHHRESDRDQSENDFCSSRMLAVLHSRAHQQGEE
jgi:hypothetical protein